MKPILSKLYTGILSLPLNLLYVWPQSIYKMVRNLLSMTKISYNSEENTLFPSEDRISRIEVFHHLLKWYIKYGEVNYRFYQYGMDRKNGHKRDQCIGHRYFRDIRDEKNFNPDVREDYRFNYLSLLRDKFVFSKYMSGFSIPVVKDLAIFNKENLMWLDTGQIYETFAFFKNSNEMIDGFCKPVDSNKGKDIFSLKLMDGLLFEFNKAITVDNLINRINGKYVLQEKIFQHSLMEEFHPHSVNTVRIVTYYNNGDPELFLGMMRTGTNGRNVDNFSAGGIAIGIDLENEKLNKYGLHNIDGDTYQYTDYHPDTGFRFESFEIPYLKETLALIKKAHKWLYGIHSIGWDVAITPTGPVIIEANDQWDGMLFMALHQGFKDRFMKYYSN